MAPSSPTVRASVTVASGAPSVPRTVAAYSETEASSGESWAWGEGCTTTTMLPVDAAGTGPGARRARRVRWACARGRCCGRGAAASGPMDGCVCAAPGTAWISGCSATRSAAGEARSAGTGDAAGATSRAGGRKSTPSRAAMRAAPATTAGTAHRAGPGRGARSVARSRSSASGDICGAGCSARAFLISSRLPYSRRQAAQDKRCARTEATTPGSSRSSISWLSARAIRRHAARLICLPPPTAPRTPAAASPAPGGAALRWSCSSSP